IPEPNKALSFEYFRHGIKIGDVGMMTDPGGCDFLFNSSLLRELAINPRDLPREFVTFYSSSIDFQKFSEFGPECHISSRFITGSPQASEGAILALPLGLNSEDILGIDGLRRFAASHAKDWYLYANKIRYRSTRNGNLRLVIGHDKTSAWGMATFQRFPLGNGNGTRQGDGALLV
ncbi:hypothetical protein CPB84DRAFT_1672694, partial [Gymnopilus junonius]